MANEAISYDDFADRAGPLMSSLTLADLTEESLCGILRGAWEDCAWIATLTDQRIQRAIIDHLPPIVRDAARYRYLRDRDLDTIHKGGVFAGMTPKNVVLNGGDLDAAIDAALRK